MSIRVILSILLSILALLPTANAAVACNATQTCEELLYPGSECSDDGFCTNPYTKRGCLANRVPGWKKTRVCNSDDPPNAASLGICREPYAGLEYTEIRLTGQNWEAAFFGAWILQIILSELLDVPTSLESGEADKKISFYDENNSLDYGVAYPWDGLETANRVKDCRNIKNEGDNYTMCFHVMGEVWYTNWRQQVEKLEENGVIEPSHFLGIIGEDGWYIPRFTAERDPTLLTHLTLVGEENRRKLAETFLSPTTWSEYCNEVSPDNCTTPNNVTVRGPNDIEEGAMYFLEGSYTGHFRATGDQDCDANPLTCHGHFADYPCGWSSYFQTQAYQNNIALNTTGDQPYGVGYSYPRLIETWHAANATKSNVIMHWWQPEALYNLYIGTDAEFQKVDLPPPTLECLRSRIDIDEDRCKGDFVAEQGNPEGACDTADQNLRRLINVGLFEETNHPSIPEARRSPAYDAVRNFNIDNLQLDQIFALWLNRSVDPYGFDPREAVCQWVSDNLDTIQAFVPPTYPRAIREAPQFDPLRYTSLALGILAVILVWLSFVATYVKRKTTQIQYAQLDFMFLLLCGLLLVSIAALLSAISNSNAQCVSLAWLINVGYTLELVPLIIKVYAINRLIQAAKRFRRVELKRVSLFGVVFALTFITFIFLIIWSAIDPMQIASQYLLTSETNDAGETIVSVSYYCRSASDAWGFISLGVQGFLLFVASVLAFQMRNIRHELNESQSLAIMIYSDFIFWVLRLVSFVWLEKSDFASAVPGIYSLILAIDSIASICIYFLPKFFCKESKRQPGTVFDPTVATKSMRAFPNGTENTSSDNTPATNDDNKSATIHGANCFKYEGECPHCGRGIEQDLLCTELESPGVMTTLLNSCNRHTSQECHNGGSGRRRSLSWDCLLRPPDL